MQPSISNILQNSLRLLSSLLGRKELEVVKHNEAGDYKVAAEDALMFKNNHNRNPSAQNVVEIALPGAPSYPSANLKGRR